MRRLCLLKKSLFFVSLLGVFSMSSCSDNVDEDDIYTFRGETITNYLENSETYDGYAYLLSRTKLSKRSESTVAQLLSARGNYTVFAPTNDALKYYLDSIYQTKDFDIQLVDDSIANFIVRNSIIDCESHKAYETTEFSIGTLPRTNMDDRYLSVDFDTISGGKAIAILNNTSRIIHPDIEMYNGYIHGVDHVISLSRASVPALIESADNMRIFNHLLVMTGWVDSMKLYRDEYYEDNHEDYVAVPGGYTLKQPEHRYYGYTAFVETDSVFNEKWGIPMPVAPNGILQNSEEIMEKIKERCEEIYPHATNPNLKNTDNAINQFVAYHLLPMRLTWDKLVIHYIEMGYAYKNPDRLTIDCFNYYETMGPYRRLMKLTDGAQTNGKRINRHAKYDLQRFDEIECDREGVLIYNDNGKNPNNALNGFYYPINDILLYDKDVPGVVLNERLRWDITDILPEMSNNGLRRKWDNTDIAIPSGYFENLEFTKESNCLYYPYYDTWSQSNWQADEMNIRGQYDLTLKLPPVPNDGTYELRFCAPSNAGFGMAQFYIGKSKYNMQAVGLPVDLRIPPSNPNIGWEADTNDKQHNDENDKNMRHHGYMKPPRHNGIAKNGAAVTESMRTTTYYAINLRMRRIIWTGNVKPQDNVYIRIKGLLDNPVACFLLDYLEWCPKHIYNGPVPEDQW